MENVDIITVNNVNIRYRTASLISRIGAMLLDGLFIVAYLSLLMYLSGVFYSFDTISFIFLVYIPIWGYFFIFETLTGGKTPGKMILRIRVTKADGSPPGILSYFLRWILKPIDMTFFIGVLFYLATKKHQRIGDLAAGTIVVKESKPINFDQVDYFYRFDDNYKVSFEDVDILTEGQNRFIMNTLIVSQKNRMSIAVKDLSARLKTKLGVQTNLDDYQFLLTLVRDYNYISSR